MMGDSNQILETMKTSFLFNFRTGNVVIDTIVTGLIIMFSSYLINFVQNLLNSDFLHLWRSYYGSKVNKIVINGKKVQGMHNTRLEYSTNFFAVLHQIKKLDCIKSDITELSEVPIQEPDSASYYDDESVSAQSGGDLKQGVRTNLIVSQARPFRLNADVYGLVNISQANDNNEKNPVKTEEFQIQICSETLSAEQLRSLLKEWVVEYERHLNRDQHLKYFVYTPGSDSHEEYYDATSHYCEFKFESGKSFDNIFYPYKKEILDRIDFFVNNKPWYKKRGIPYTLGFLLYGEPGCGKTSTIKAIANYTQRHIVSVPLNKIKSGKELLNIFYNDRMNFKVIPLHQRLYVLEDIDCADLKNIVGERSTADKKDGKDDDKDDEDRSKSPSQEKASETNADDGNAGSLDLLNFLKAGPALDWTKKSQKLTLSTLLEVLDGVMEMDGRMLIVTTNYPERLDKALIRPGRIDMKVKFDRCDRASLVEMYEHYFDMTVPADWDVSRLPEGRWTPAEATQIFLNHMKEPLNGLEELCNGEPASFS